MEKQPAADLSARYHRFAEQEAAGRSQLYDTLARGVGGGRQTIDFLLTLPTDKRQPNLLFAAVRHLFGTPRTWTGFRATLLANREAVRAVMLDHATQTNEPARCATLLPVLRALPQPLALLEVGASAGLCLLPDHYGYDYGRRQIRPAASIADLPVFHCAANLATPLPADVPQVVWRAGLDLNPLDGSDPAQHAWLETLVWPEQTRRLADLRSALKIAAIVRPRVVKGNLLSDDLERLCQQAPKDATLVVFHTAVLAYVADPAARNAFARRVMSLCPYWISNESPLVFPPDTPVHAAAPGRFLLSVNGIPVAWTDPHGTAVDWLSAD